MSIFDVRHQNRAHRVIQRALGCGRMPHAYLFAGPEGVGKEMLAMRLAKVLLCGSRKQVPMPEGIFTDGGDTPPLASPLDEVGAQQGTGPPDRAQGSGFRSASGETRRGEVQGSGFPSAPRSAVASGVQGSVADEGMPTQSRGHGTPLTQGGGHGTLDEALDACGKCEDCVLVDAGTHPDLYLIYRQLNKQHPESTIRKQKALFLGVEIIRHFLIERAGMKSSRGRAKVFVLREAERLNESAQNALLKTLEEPPPDTFIILLTDALDRMLPTTRSRCQQVLFQSLPAEFVADRVRFLRPDAAVQKVVYAARHAGGSLGSALRLLDDGLFELKRAWGEQLVKLQDGRGVTPNDLAKPFMEDAGSLAKCAVDRDPEISDSDSSRVGLQTLLAALGDFYMDALRRCCGADMTPINEDQPAVVECLAAMSERSLRACLKRLADADSNLSRNANIELTIEAMFIGLSQGRTAVQAGRRAS